MGGMISPHNERKSFPPWITDSHPRPHTLDEELFPTLPPMGSPPHCSRIRSNSIGPKPKSPNNQALVSGASSESNRASTFASHLFTNCFSPNTEYRFGIRFDQKFDDQQFHEHEQQPPRSRRMNAVPECSRAMGFVSTLAAAWRN